MIHISNIEHTGQAFIVLPVDLDTMVPNVTIGYFLLHDIELWRPDLVIKVKGS